jgi:hypothetical protein
MKTNDVPFVENPDDRCFVANVGMALAYFLPDKHFGMPELETLCGYEKGRGTWKALPMLNLSKLGLQVHWIEAFDHEQFVTEPKAYLHSILDDEAYEWQIAHGNLEQEVARVQQYMGSGLPLENRKGTQADIQNFLDDGWLVSLDVNARVLSGKPGYDGHSVLAIGYDNDGVVVHNPDGESGNKPNQHVSWELLDKARNDFGGTYSIYAFKK